jgi:hypothetical protein
MTANQQKSHIIDKRNALSLIFKDILCFQNSSNYIPPFPQNILIPMEVFRYQKGINPQISINRIF